MMRRWVRHLISYGRIVADVEIEVSDDLEPQGPMTSAAEASKIDEVREAIQRRENVAAAPRATTCRLTPIASPLLPTVNAA